MRCKTRVLSEAERDLITAAKSIDEKYVRPSEEEVLALLTKITTNSDESDESSSEAEREAVKDLG